jgi:hypothetical protein
MAIPTDSDAFRRIPSFEQSGLFQKLCHTDISGANCARDVSGDSKYMSVQKNIGRK